MAAWALLRSERSAPVTPWVPVSLDVCRPIVFSPAGLMASTLPSDIARKPKPLSATLTFCTTSASWSSVMSAPAAPATAFLSRDHSGWKKLTISLPVIASV
ncbi:hypothetical protein D9M72_614540 [compost metagenome]